MNAANDQTSLEAAIQVIQSGDKEQGRRILADVLAADPKNDQAWLWLARCVPDDARKRYCLEKALMLQPDNQEARLELAELQPAAAPGAEPAPEQAGAPAEETAPPLATTEEGEPEPEASETGQNPPAVPPPVAPAKPAPKPAPRKSRLSCLQMLLLLILALAAGGVVIGGIIFILQNGETPVSPALQNPVQADNTPQVFSLPPTWTATASLVPAPTSFRLTATLPDTPTPVSTITPVPQEWSLVIGRSAGRRPIEVLRFGTGPNKRMIIAGIHGKAEANTITLADQLIETVRKNPEIVPRDVTLYILRSLNPDGETGSTTGGGRLNANGVDLNRNFDANWKAAWQGASCASPASSAGKAASSEPETQALMKFLIGRQVEALINYHSAGLGVFPSGNPPDPGSVSLAEAVSRASGYAYPPVKTDCEFTGTLADWAAQNGARAAIDVELNDKNDPELARNLKVLDVLLNWKAPVFISPTATTGATPVVTSTLAVSPAVTPTLTVSPAVTP